MFVTCFSAIGEVMPIEHIVVTVGTGPQVRQLTMARQSRNQFVTTVELKSGPNHFTATARTESGNRLRAAVTIEAARN